METNIWKPWCLVASNKQQTSMDAQWEIFHFGINNSQCWKGKYQNISYPKTSKKIDNTFLSLCLLVSPTFWSCKKEKETKFCLKRIHKIQIFWWFWCHEWIGEQIHRFLLKNSWKHVLNSILDTNLFCNRNHRLWSSIHNEKNPWSRRELQNLVYPGVFWNEMGQKP